jgi:L-lactate dehydrogenase
MKLGIVGTGEVGCAIALAAVTRGSAGEIVLVNRTRKTAAAVVTDIRYGTPLCDRVEISDVDYDGLEGSGVVLITSGLNERTGGAIDRSDPQGRLKLLDQNAGIYRQIVPQIVRAHQWRFWSPSPIRPIRLPTSRARPRVTVAY